MSARTAAPCWHGLGGNVEFRTKSTDSGRCFEVAMRSHVDLCLAWIRSDRAKTFNAKTVEFSAGSCARNAAHCGFRVLRSLRGSR